MIISIIKEPIGIVDFDYTFFTNLARWLSEDPTNQLVSINDTQGILDAIEAGRTYLCYMQGHGVKEGGTIGVRDPMTTDELQRRLMEIFGANPQRAQQLSQIKQLVITSCFSDVKTRNASGVWKSIVDGVKDVFCEIRQQYHLASIPEVLGCGGAAVLHPNKNHPILQINPIYLDHCRELMMAIDIGDEVQAKEIFDKISRGWSAETTPQEKLNQLKNIAPTIGALFIHRFDEYIKLVSDLGYLRSPNFVLNPASGKIETIPITPHPPLLHLANLSKHLQEASQWCKKRGSALLPSAKWRDEMQRLRRNIMEDIMLVRMFKELLLEDVLPPDLALQSIPLHALSMAVLPPSLISPPIESAIASPVTHQAHQALSPLSTPFSLEATTQSLQGINQGQLRPRQLPETRSSALSTRIEHWRQNLRTPQPPIPHHIASPAEGVPSITVLQLRATDAESQRPKPS